MRRRLNISFVCLALLSRQFILIHFKLLYKAGSTGSSYRTVRTHITGNIGEVVHYCNVIDNTINIIVNIVVNIW